MWQEGIAAVTKALVPSSQRGCVSTRAAQGCQAPLRSCPGISPMVSLTHCVQGAGRAIPQGTRGAVGPFRNTLTLQWCLGHPQMQLELQSGAAVSRGSGHLESQASLEHRQLLGCSDSTGVSPCRDRSFPILNHHRTIGWLSWEGP